MARGILGPAADQGDAFGFSLGDKLVVTVAK
jgi:hypothetical protein